MASLSASEFGQGDSSSFHVAVSSNEYLFGFEADIVLRVSLRGDDAANVKDASGASTKVVNVEIDGYHHGNARHRRLDAIRDSYLQSKGVSVARWTVADEAAARRLPRCEEEETKRSFLHRAASGEH